MNNTTPSNHMNTSQRINHVFACNSHPQHVTPGFKVLIAGGTCPDCGKAVYDITNTPLGQSYIALGRIDLGDLPQ